MPNKYFFELAQLSLDTREKLSNSPSGQEWFALYKESERQAILGLMLIGINKLTTEQRPPKELLLKWIATGETIRQRNIIVNQRCVQLANLMKDADLKYCIIKGQGNAMMYPDPYCRNAGDIDIWLGGGREVVKRFVLSRFPDAFDNGHHIDFPLFHDTTVDVHYIPAYLCNPLYNKRIQSWFKKESDKQFNNFIYIDNSKYDGNTMIPAPTAMFNAVHQLSHIMKHFLIEGVGIRHFIDYFYVLKKCQLENVDLSEIRYWIHRFGMANFARGVMWVEKEMLGLEDELLIYEPNQRIGELILKEIVAGGNFGRHNQKNSLINKGLVSRGIIEGRRLLGISRYMPGEAFWMIIKKIQLQHLKI